MENEKAFECPTRFPLYPNLSNLEQTLLVTLGFTYIGIMTSVFLKIYKRLDVKGAKWWSTLKQTWPLMGVFPYMASGYLFHFVDVDEFLCITPPNGTWGWWYLPVSQEFQLAATGYAEIICGFLLAVCGIMLPKHSWAVSLRQQSALVLFVITIGMTFANIFMLTHGVWAYELQEPMPVIFHAVRWTIQGLWLSNLWYMATHDSLVGGDSRNKAD